jgi:hypothetical protein
MILKQLLLIHLVLLLTIDLHAQELNCFVNINSTQLQGTTNREIFTTLQDAVSDFMNNTVWTNNIFEVNERIECNIMLNITEEVSTGQYKATLSIQSRRPVYGTSFNSVMLNYFDDEVTFKYTEFDPLDYSENTHLMNLPTILAYYAYIVIGLDYDSFSPGGGTPYFSKAEKIVTNAQSSADPGWKAFESRNRKNRYWLVNNILDDDYRSLRSFIYTYHRSGLDIMDGAVERGRLVIKDAIIELEKFYKAKPDPFTHFLKIVLDAKSDEIIQLFSEAPPQDKSRIYDIMTAIDPANISKYEVLKNN